MRILLVTHYYAPEVGAAQHRWDALVQRFVSAGHQVAVLTPSPHFPRRGAQTVPEGMRPGSRHRGRHGEMILRLHYLEHGTGLRLRMLDQLVAAVDAVRRGLLAFGRAGARPDVVIATAPGLPTIPAGLALRWTLRRPLVLEMRDAWPDLIDNHREWGSEASSQEPPGPEGSRLGRPARWVVAHGVTYLQRRADAIVTTTQSFSTTLRGRGMPPVTTVRNSTLAEQWVAPLPTPGLGDEALRVLYLGTVGRSQGLSAAIRATAYLHERGVPLRLRIVGDGASRRGLEELCERLSAPVEFHDPVPHTHVAEHYKWADTVLVSLRGWEPFRWTVPSKLYEALATGRHITAVLSGEAAEIVHEAGAGDVVSPGDIDELVACWERLSADRGRLNVVDTGGRWVRAHASPDVLAGQYLTVLEDVLASSGQRLSRFRELTRNVALLVRAMVAHLGDDPFLLLLQVSRRLPQALREPLSRALTSGAGGHSVSVVAAFGHWLADRPEDATRIVRQMSTASGHLRLRLLAELALRLEVNDVAGPSSISPPTLRARAAWVRGDVSGALEALAGAPGDLRDRILGEQRLLRPGARLAAPRPSRVHRRPMVALHVLTNSLPTTQSGYAIRSHEVLRAQRGVGIDASAVTRIGYPVSVGLPLAHHRDVVDGVTYRRILPPRLERTPDGRLDQMVREVLQRVEELQPSVLHTTTNYTNALVTSAVAAATGLPWVYEVRGLLEDSWLAGLPESMRSEAAASERYQLLKAKETEMAVAADAVVTLSRTLRDDLLGRGVPKERITVVPNAVDAALLDQSVPPEQARAGLGLPREGFWVGTVSSLVGYEGLDTLVTAIAQLRARGVDARSLIVGDGVSRPELVDLVSRLGLSEVVRLPGRVPRERAIRYHQALDVFVVPRRDERVCRTVTPLKPVEAMALSRPVVASDLPALAEIVGMPGAGVLVPPGDPARLADELHKLADDPRQRVSLGQCGRAFAKDRTWRSVGQRYHDLYERLASREGQNLIRRGLR